MSQVVPTCPSPHSSFTLVTALGIILAKMVVTNKKKLVAYMRSMNAHDLGYRYPRADIRISTVRQECITQAELRRQIPHSHYHWEYVPCFLTCFDKLRDTIPAFPNNRFCSSHRMSAHRVVHFYDLCTYVLVHSKASKASRPTTKSDCHAWLWCAPSWGAGPQHFLGTLFSGYVKPVQSHGGINTDLCTMESVVEDVFRYLTEH